MGELRSHKLRVGGDLVDCYSYTIFLANSNIIKPVNPKLLNLRPKLPLITNSSCECHEKQNQKEKLQSANTCPRKFRALNQYKHYGIEF